MRTSGGVRGWPGAAAAIALAASVALALPAPQASAGKLQTSPLGVQLKPIGNFVNPVYVTQAPGEPGTVYVVEQPGRVIAVRKGHRFRRPFLDLTERVRFGPEETRSVEAGMLSMAFDPNYASNGRFYVFYSGPGGNNFVDEFRRSGKRVLRADNRSRELVLKINHPYADSHNGGQLQFGPDGLLWVSTGDGGCCGDVEDQARSLGTLLGKLVRINPRARKPGFRVPRNNPLLGLPGRDALMSWGLRNPWRFSFDRLTTNLIIADVGDSGNAEEEVDYVSLAGARGSNFGWPEYEGFAIYDPERPASPTPVRPIHSYQQGKNACAITGGYVVRDPGLPQLYGRYLYSDYCTGRMRSFIPPPLDPADPNPPAGVANDDRDEGLFVRYPTSFGEGTNGQLYVASQRGPVYRLQAKRAKRQ